MTLPAMAELVDELEQAGYVARRPDPSDDRAKLIRPTHEGRRALAKALRAVREIEDQYAEGIGAERFDALVSSLEAVLDVQSRSDEQRRGLGSNGSRVPTSRPSGPTEPRPNVAASTAARSRARASRASS